MIIVPKARCAFGATNREFIFLWIIHCSPYLYIFILRSPSLLNSVDKSRADTSRPVFVSDFPQELRNAVRDDISAPRTGNCLLFPIL